MLTVEDLHVSIGSSEILRGVSLAVGPGEMACILGANGAGKTTLLRAVMGYLRPSGGHVLVAGQDVTGWAPHRVARAGVGYSPEDSGIFAGLTVEENIRTATWAQPARGPAEERVALARSVFPALGRCWGRRGTELSGGERKMLSIARAMATNPDLLILDEPFEGLSPAVLPQVAEAIAAITATGRSILLAESNARHLPDSASSVCVLERGECVASSTRIPEGLGMRSTASAVARKSQAGGEGGGTVRLPWSKGLINPTALPSGSSTTAYRAPQKASYGSCWPA